MSVKLKNGSGVSPLHQTGQSRNGSVTVAVPKERRRLAHGKERSDAALSHQSQDTSNPEGTKDSRTLALSEIVVPRRWKASPGDHPDLHYIGLEHVEAHTTRLLGSVPATEMRSTANRFQSGDVLYSRLRPYLNKVWRADREGLCSSEFIVLPGNESVGSAYLCYRLNAHDFVSFANSLNAGDRPRVDFDQIATFKTWLPSSLPEQRKIVAEIEKQFTRLEAGVTALRRVQANLKRYRAAVLKAACEGRLVPTEAELVKTGNRKAKFETGEALLARIVTERQKNWQGRGHYKEPVAPDTEKLPTLPEGWTWVSADQISSQITDGEHIQPRYTTEGYPMLSAKHVRNGYVIYTDAPFISEADFQACLKRCAPTRDDILIVCVGATTGRAAIVGDAKPFAVVRSVLLIRALIHPRFMLAWVQSPWCQTWIQSASGSSAQAHFYINNAKNMSVPLPPLAEQTRIVAEVERRLSVVEELNSVVSANLQRAIRLRQSILQKAFTGRL